MRLGIIAFSEKGIALGERLQLLLSGKGDAAELTRCESGGLDSWTKVHFASCDGLIFISSCGIAVRAIAPYVQSKTKDPAVVVVDELGTYGISLLSGHLGGANRLAKEISDLISACPVITTATDLSSVFAVDLWAEKLGLFIVNPEHIKWVSSRLLDGQTLKLQSSFLISDKLPVGLMVGTADQYDILVSYQAHGRAETLHLVPPVITLGVGCKRGTNVEKLEHAYDLILNKLNVHPAAVKRVCSIELKAREPGILEFCRRHSFPYYTYSPAELAALPGVFSGSDFVKSVTGIDNVCERSAVLGSGGGRLFAGKNAGFGVTMALAIEPYALRFDTKGGSQ